MTPRGAYKNKPHKTIEELTREAYERGKTSRQPVYDIAQDIVDGYSLDWGSANTRLIVQSAIRGRADS